MNQGLCDETVEPYMVALTTLAKDYSTLGIRQAS
jgi:hypothetical protein